MDENLKTSGSPSVEVAGSDMGAVNPEGVEVGNSTPSAGDVGADLQKLLQEKQRLEEDLRKLKSTSDKRIAQLEKAYKEEIAQLNEALKEAKSELERLRELVLNDDNARKKYEDLRAQSETEELRKKLAEYEQRLQEESIKRNWIAFFNSLGISVSPEGDLDEIARQGWEGVKRELEELRKKVKSQSQQESETSNEQPQRPTPRTDAPTNPPSKVSWADLIKRYGSEERVFRAVELGLLPPDILPY
ncbi:MAG: hypothetical protein ACPLPV_04120 [Methanomassiliicoccales archaeon]